jgi:predicted metalloprotease with PDZ domain
VRKIAEGAGERCAVAGGSAQQVIPPIRRIRKLLPWLAVIIAAAAPSARATVSYSISLANPEKHVFHVTMSIPDVSGDVTVQMPAWNALYQIRDFSAHLQRVEAFVGASPTAIEKLDKQTWRITGTGAVTVRYATYWDEAGPFAAQINSDHAFINAAMVLMYVPERRAEESTVCLVEVPFGWNTSIGSGAPNSCNSTRNYDGLADSPIEAGRFDAFDLRGFQPNIRVIVHGDNWKRKRVEEELTRICKYEIKLMGGAPFPSYTFILHIGKAAAGAGGGMEHADSTAINIPSDEYLKGVSAHEFFHLWNVKRIRPASLEPVDYSKEQYTRALWFAEGVTSTYGSYTLLRSGLWSKAEFYIDLSEQITELEERPAELWQSAEESSLDAWLEKYSLYNRGDESISYYTQGQVLGVLLDILIRERTQNQHSLDDVLRLMNDEFAKSGRTYRDSLDIRLSVEKVAGGSFAEFFSRYVAGPGPLPYKDVLAHAGLDLRTVERRRAALGFSMEKDASSSAIVRSVEANGFAAQAGVRVDDVILAWNGGDIPRRLEHWTSAQKSGAILHLRVRREGKEIELDVRLGETVDMRYDVVEVSHAGADALRLREGLLHGTTSATTAQGSSRVAP